jgi:hypothetical protein
VVVVVVGVVVAATLSGVLLAGFESAFALVAVLVATAFFTLFLGCTSTTVLWKLCWECVAGAGVGGGVTTRAGW